MESTPTRRCEFCGADLEPRYVELPKGMRTKRREKASWLERLRAGEPAEVNERLLVGFRACSCPDAVRKAEREERERAEEERAKAEAELARRYDLAGIPPKFIGAETDDEQCIATVMGGKGLYVQGPNGTGKTYFAIAVAKRVIRAGKMVRVTSAVKIKGELFSTFGSKTTEEEVYSRLVRPYLLVIDDLGKECDSKTVVSMLYRVINERDERMRPVIITTNFSKQELGEKLAESGDVSSAEAIVSRLFGMTEKIEIDGEDRRMQ